MRAAAVIVAAGRGSRLEGGDVPKQYRAIRGRPILRHSVEALAGYPGIIAIQVVIDPEHRTLYDAATHGLGNKLLPPVPGGAERQGSCLAGLEALEPHKPDAVLIHDAARPFVGAGIISRVIEGLSAYTGCIAAMPVTDTLKREGAGGTIASTLPRERLWRAQTPQGFRFPEILAAHRRAAAAGRTDFTDDAAIAEWAGMPVALVPGAESNRKITTAEDLLLADQYSSWPDIRSGSGFDVHRFNEGDHVMLCGVRVPHTHGLEGHSDADAPLHAVTDALLGAIGAGDIGDHFPPSDQQWKGAASSLFLAEAARLVFALGGRISNVDVTIMCEAPRIGPHRAAMCATIAAILKLDASRVSVKATTTERLGFTGRREGLAAMATATVLLPPATSLPMEA